MYRDLSLISETKPVSSVISYADMQIFKETKRFPFILQDPVGFKLLQLVMFMI